MMRGWVEFNEGKKYSTPSECGINDGVGGLEGPE